jgi:hypothetical protein
MLTGFRHHRQQQLPYQHFLQQQQEQEQQQRRAYELAAAQGTLPSSAGFHFGTAPNFLPDSSTSH